MAKDAKGKEVAVKKVRPTADVLQLRCCLRELAILQHFGQHEHPNLLGLRTVMRPPAGELAGWQDLYLVTDLLDSDLHQVIKSDQQLTDDHCKWFMWQLLRGLHALHAAGVVHRDLKPSNLLVNENCDLKVADYGISRGVAAAAPGGAAEAADDDVLKMTSYVVTRWYRCPELLCGNKRYDCSVDVWSVGCVLADLLGRAPLFGGANHMAMLREIVELLGTPDDAALDAIQDPRAVAFLRRMDEEEGTAWGEVFPDASEQALDLLSQLLVFDPARRLSVRDALKHPWLASLHTEADFVAPPPCPFNFELCDLTLDHYLLAGLDAVRAFHPDYPLKVSEMLRFGIMHNRTADEVHRRTGGGGAAAAAAQEGHQEGSPEAPLFKEQFFPLHARVRHLLRGLGTVTELMEDGRTRVRFDSGEEHRCAPAAPSRRAPTTARTGWRTDVSAARPVLRRPTQLDAKILRGARGRARAAERQQEGIG